MTIRVFIVDDQQLVRAGFRMLIDSQDDMTVVGEAGDGKSAVDAVRSTATDVVLMDVRMPVMDGVEASTIIASRGELPRIVVLTTFDLDEYVHAALRAGASAFLLKDTQPDMLLESIRHVHAGDAVVAPSATRRMLERFVEQPTPGTPADTSRLRELTSRELEVLTLIASGMSNTEIAAHLVVAEPTVKTHVSRILSKTNSRDRVQLVVLGYETGLVTPGHTQV